MWHPFIPYVTETVWSSLDDGLLMIKQWPKEDNLNIDEEATQKINKLQEVIIAIRNARSENKIEPGRKIKAIIVTKLEIEDGSELIKGLKTGIEELEIVSSGEAPAGSIVITDKDLDIYLLGAVDEEKEKARLIKEKENLEKVITNLRARLKNEEFVAKAPANIVAAENEKLNGYILELDKINKLIV